MVGLAAGILFKRGITEGRSEVGTFWSLMSLILLEFNLSLLVFIIFW